jgi:hypothetical protein
VRFDFPITALDGQQAVDATTNTIYIYQTQAPAGWKAVANPGAAIAIDGLLGDVTATGPGVVAATVAKIAGNTVVGTTGSTNVVFSASPTLSGTIKLSGFAPSQILASGCGQQYSVAYDCDLSKFNRIKLCKGRHKRNTNAVKR